MLDPRRRASATDGEGAGGQIPIHESIAVGLNSERQLVRSLTGEIKLVTIEIAGATDIPLSVAVHELDQQIDFLDAEHVFAGQTLTVQDTRHAYGEARFQTVGFLGECMVMVVWTPRGEARHVMSMRKCNAKERKRYSQRFAQA